MILKPIDSSYNEKFHNILWKAKEYVKNNFDKLSKLEVGKHDLSKEIADGTFVNINEYDTKDEPKWESHLKYVDIQVIFSGEEDFIVENIKNLKKKAEYDSEKDYQDWEGEGYTRLTLKKGDMLILLPYDAHRVGLHPKSGKQHVKKAILKVPYIK